MCIRYVKKGSAWWTNEIKEAVENKKRAYKEVIVKEFARGREKKGREHIGRSVKLRG